jgi:hypothetical protein
MNTTGPFGVRMGMTLEEIGGKAEEVAPGRYLVATLPKPHSAFSSYVVQVTPRCGLSWVKGIGETIQTNVYGLGVITAFDSLEKKLSDTYGKGERTDTLLPDSIWDEPRDWMQSMLAGERFLMTVWSPEHGCALPNSLVSVGLIAGATDDTHGYISVEYSFENAASADEEIAADEDDAL